MGAFQPVGVSLRNGKLPFLGLKKQQAGRLLLGKGREAFALTFKN
jgi:hypothetical protein